MKTKKRSKILSLLLALSMLVGMVPFSVIPAMAAGFGDVQVTSSYPYDPNPQWVEINNSSGNQRGISSLKSLMDTTGPGYKVKYIKLTSDLEYLGDDNFNLTMSVNECVHLDLNGHELIYGVEDKDVSSRCDIAVEVRRKLPDCRVYLVCEDGHPEKLAALEKAVELKLIDGYCIGGLTARQAEIWLAETARAMNERTEP